MAPQTVLITGCSKGIGLATAVLLAKETQHQFKVYATMRNLGSKGNLEEASGDTLNKTLFIRELDVTKEATIKAVVDEILSEDGKIDVLVNNAGVMGPNFIDQKPMEWCQAMMDTNFWGVVRCVRAVLPAMKKQKSGQIINVTSITGLLGFPFFDMYASSKSAVEGFSESIAPVLQGYNIRISLVEPGPVRTDMTRDIKAGAPKEECEDLDDILKEMYCSRMKVVDKMDAIMQDPDEIAQVHLEIILSESPHLRYQTSELMRIQAATKLTDITSDRMLYTLKH